MKRTFLGLVMLTALLVLPFNALGEDHGEQAGEEEEKRSLEERRELEKKRIEEIKTNSDRAREEAKNNLEQERERIKNDTAANREEMKTRLENHRVELKEKLTAIKDEKKKEAIVRVQDNLTALNLRMTKHYLSVLNKLGGVLERIISRTNKAGERGLDVASVRTAITAAQSSMTAARSAVGAQTEKTYLVEISEENKLKADVGSARQRLNADIKAVHRAVKAAHDAVRKAATTLARISRVDEAPKDDLENSTSTDE